MGIEKMKNRLIRYVLIVLLWGVCHTEAFAFQYDRNDPAQGWGYQPVYAAPTVPDYRFYSTTPGSSSITHTKSGSYVRRAVKSSWDDPDEDDPAGVVPDPMPIGDAPWLFLLLLAAGYTVCRVVWLNSWSRL